MTPATSHNYSVLWGLATFAVVGVLILFLRWAYSGKRDSLLARRTRTGTESEYGLLSPLAAPRDSTEGNAICALLQAGGIRGTLVHTHSGLRVMVFPNDLPRAKRLLLDSGTA